MQILDSRLCLPAGRQGFGISTISASTLGGDRRVNG